MNLKDLKLINENIDLNKYFDYQSIVKKNMSNPIWLGDFKKIDLEFLIQNGCKIWIFYNDESWVCSMMVLPAQREDLNMFELDYDYKKCIDYGPMFVNPKFIGNALQYQMLMYLDDYCYKLGYEYAISTVHPDNIFSINNLIKDGFIFTKQKIFKRGIRNIYCKRLK